MGQVFEPRHFALAEDSRRILRVETLDQPADHRWHHGLWFSWKFIDGVNYWEHDGNTGRPAGRTSWRPTEFTTHADGSARIVRDLDYSPPDGTPVIS